MLCLWVYTCCDDQQTVACCQQVFLCSIKPQQGLVDWPALANSVRHGATVTWKLYLCRWYVACYQL